MPEVILSMCVLVASGAKKQGDLPSFWVDGHYVSEIEYEKKSRGGKNHPQALWCASNMLSVLLRRGLIVWSIAGWLSAVYADYWLTNVPLKGNRYIRGLPIYFV